MQRNSRRRGSKRTRFDWGGHGSYTNFLINKTPTKPSALDVADAAWKAHRELDAIHREVKRQHQAAGLEWDPAWDRDRMVVPPHLAAVGIVLLRLVLLVAANVIWFALLLGLAAWALG
jgi:hypothetical protein